MKGQQDYTGEMCARLSGAVVSKSSNINWFVGKLPIASLALLSLSVQKNNSGSCWSRTPNWDWNWLSFAQRTAITPKIPLINNRFSQIRNILRQQTMLRALSSGACTKSQQDAEHRPQVPHGQAVSRAPHEPPGDERVGKLEPGTCVESWSCWHLAWWPSCTLWTLWIGGKFQL